MVVLVVVSLPPRGAAHPGPPPLPPLFLHQAAVAAGADDAGVRGAGAAPALPARAHAVAGPPALPPRPGAPRPRLAVRPILLVAVVLRVGLRVRPLVRGPVRDDVVEPHIRVAVRGHVPRSERHGRVEDPEGEARNVRVVHRPAARARTESGKHALDRARRAPVPGSSAGGRDSPVRVNHVAADRRMPRRKLGTERVNGAAVQENHRLDLQGARSHRTGGPGSPGRRRGRGKGRHRAQAHRSVTAKLLAGTLHLGERPHWPEKERDPVCPEQ